MRTWIAAALIALTAGCGPSNQAADADKPVPTASVAASPTMPVAASPSASVPFHEGTRYLTVVAAATVDGIPQVTYNERPGLDIQVTDVVKGKSWLVKWVVSAPLKFVAASDYPGNYDVVATGNSVVLGIDPGTRQSIWIETVQAASK